MILYAQGKCSWFGGPEDHGVGPHENLALFDRGDLDNPRYKHLFLDYQPHGTTGVARRLNPDVYYCACRWEYSILSKKWLRTHMVKITSLKNEKLSFLVQPVDWGPNQHTGRCADLSHGLLKALDLETDGHVKVEYFLDQKQIEV